MPRLARKSLNNPWLHLLLVVVLLGRALIPVGYMPGQGGLALCPAYGSGIDAGGHDMSGMDMSGMDMSGMDMSVHRAHMGHGGGHAGHGMGHEGSCAYATAAAASALAGGQSPPPVAYVPNVPLAVTPPAERPVLRGTIVPTRLPRGPPALS
jgi:hypothetical protein